MLPSRLEADRRAVARTSYAIRSRTSDDNWLEIDSTLVDELTTYPLPDPPRQLANLIAWLKQEAGDVASARIDISDRNVLTAITGASDAEALEHLLRWAAKENLIEFSQDWKNATLTLRAWNGDKNEEAATGHVERAEQRVESVKGHCPQCRSARWADVMASHEEHSEDDRSSVWAIDTYNILRCRGCGSVYVQHMHVFSEDWDIETNPATGEDEMVPVLKVTYWPAPARRERPGWLEKLEDSMLRDLLEEVYGALAGC